MSRKLKRYMVGYDSDRQTVYGKNENPVDDSDTGVRYADAMTLKQAQRKLKELQDKPPSTIYKLVPVLFRTGKWKV